MARAIAGSKVVATGYSGGCDGQCDSIVEALFAGLAFAFFVHGGR
jgi:hypothetical protein